MFIIYGKTPLSSPFAPHSLPPSRHVVQFIADCFYKEETWAESDLEHFRDEAKACAQESQTTLYTPDLGEDENSHDSTEIVDKNNFFLKARKVISFGFRQWTRKISKKP